MKRIRISHHYSPCDIFGGLVLRLVFALVLLAGLAERVDAASRMYWTDASTYKIQRANLDGSGIEDLVSTVSYPGAIVLDVPGAKMYWAEIGELKIRRANLDGSAVEGLVGSVGPAAISLDVPGGKMYWTDSFVTGWIQRANLDGSGVEDLITFGADRHGIALDVSGGKMYFTERALKRIQRANLDGSGEESLVTTGLIDPREIDLDLASGKMYWTDARGHSIQRANLDGSGVEDLVTGLGNPSGIALDVAGGKMYWTDFGTDKIQRANLDGSGVEDLVTGLATPVGIALELEPSVPIQTLVPTLFADQDMPVGICTVYGRMNSNPGTEVCLDCLLSSPVDSLIDGTWCGNQIKMDTGVVDADTGTLYAITRNESGNPKVGQFPYGGQFVIDGDGGDDLANFDGCPQSLDEICVDANEACVSGYDGDIVAAVHAGVYNADGEETAWLKECLEYTTEPELYCQEWGTGFAKNWATYVHVWCNTGLPGDCLDGRLACDGGEAICRPVQTSPEVCDDGLDNDCDGYTDLEDVEDCPTMYECPCWNESVLVSVERTLLDPVYCREDGVPESPTRDMSVYILAGDPTASVARYETAGPVPVDEYYCILRDSEYEEFNRAATDIGENAAIRCRQLLVDSGLWNLNCNL